MNRQYVSLDVEVFEQYFTVFHVEPLTEQKCLYILTAQVGNIVYSSLVSALYAETLIREQQELLDEINSIGKTLELEAV